MKTRDIVRKLLGKPTSDERRRAEKAVAREQKASAQAEAKAAKNAERQSLAQTEERRQQKVQASIVAAYEAEAAAPGFDLRFPHPVQNYNQKPCASYIEYKDVFAREAVMRQLPALLQICGYQERQPDFAMLDYGCGLGRLAYAFSSYFGDQAGRRYFGYQVHPEALEFLKKAYAAYPNVSVFGDPIQLDDSYVEIHEQETTSLNNEVKRIPAEAVRLTPGVDRSLDLQFSSSVFTHMYRPGIVHVLKEVTGLMKPGGLCVNTWLVVDRLAATALRCGLADRALPFENSEQGFLYYREGNPLMCTAYRLEAIQAIYAEAGHEIVDILWGHWSGRQPTHQFSRQDAVISRPRSTST